MSSSIIMLDKPAQVTIEPPKPVDGMKPHRGLEKDGDALHANTSSCRQCCRRSGCREDQSEYSFHENHGHCHNSRLRRVLFPSLLILLTLFAVLGLSCLSGSGNIFEPILGSLAKRAVDDQNGDAFIDRKLYLIIIFVGLVVVIILGIMLSFWCCKGAFQNPLCCPCYLCACCGGLACLECIGCGLCAEGIDQM